MIKTIAINGKEIRYEFKRSHRRNVVAKIRRDGVIEVRAPLLYRESDMLTFLTNTADGFLIISTGCKTLKIKRKSTSLARCIIISAKNIRFKWWKTVKTLSQLKVTHWLSAV